MKNFFPLICNFLAFFLLLVVSVRSNIVDESCAKIAEGEEYDFCVASLISNPRSKNAKSTWSLIPIGIRIARSNATAIGETIFKLLEGSLEEFIRLCLQDCSQLYSEMDLTSALEAFRSRDYDSVKTVLSAVMTSSSTCEDGFKEREGYVSPLTKENQDFFKLARIPLAFVNNI